MTAHDDRSAASETPSPRSRRLGVPARLALAGASLIVTVALIAGLAGLLKPSSTGNEPLVPAHATRDGGLLVAPPAAAAHGAGAVASDVPRLEIYADYSDPVSATFASVNGLALADGMRRGLFAVVIHPVVLATGERAEASDLAANAVACVAEHSPDDLWAFHIAVLGNQSQWPRLGISPEDFEVLARDAGVGDLAGVRRCISGDTFHHWVANQSARAGSGVLANSHLTPGQRPMVFVRGTPYLGAPENSGEFRDFLIACLNDA